MTGRQPIHRDDEGRMAEEIGLDLETLAAHEGIRPTDGFTDRVMAAVSREPLPQPARAFGAALVARHLGPALAAARDAWRVVGSGSTPFAVRAQALALVVVVAAGSLVLAGGATVGAIDLISAVQPPHSSPTAPLPGLLPPSPGPSPTPTLSSDGPQASQAPEATETTEATETPEVTSTPGGSQKPGTGAETAQPTGTDDHGGGSGGDRTPNPSPTATGDHGGGSGGGETPASSPTGTNAHSGGDG